jgi:hypothetical protein
LSLHLTLHMKIETDIPRPEPIERTSRIFGDIQVRVDSMEVGASVLVDEDLARCIQARFIYQGKTSTRRKDQETGKYRVWRVS